MPELRNAKHVNNAINDFMQKQNMLFFSLSARNAKMQKIMCTKKINFFEILQ